jgi:hypothetical protein
MSAFVPLSTASALENSPDADGEPDLDYVKQEDRDEFEEQEPLDDGLEIKDRLPPPITQYSTTAELHGISVMSAFRLPGLTGSSTRTNSSRGN